jgi:hypothetical protein
MSARISTAMAAVFVALSAATSLAGCGPDDERPRVCSTGGSRGAVVTALGFTRIVKEGVAPGFNLDGMVSDGTDYISCGKVDFTSPEGTVGVDNQLAKLVPDVEEIVGNAVDGLLQGAINDGQLVILMDLDGVDDFVNDPCVDVSVQVGEKRRPSLGTDGEIEAYQTFNPDAAAELSHTNLAQIKDGVLEAGPFPLAIPLAIFDVAFTVHVQDAHIRMTIDNDGKMRGYLGGGIFPGEITDGVKNGAGLADIVPLIRLALDASTDLGWNEEEGLCEQLSATLEMAAVPAFVRR